MKYEQLKNAARRITMPEEMKSRVEQNCNAQITHSRKERNMKTNNQFFRKPAAVFAAAAICLSVSFTAAASSGTLKGFFRDITDYRGAVVGTSYEQATDEISMDVAVSGEKLTVLAVFFDPHAFPYREAQKLGIASYQIVDTNGKTVKEGSAQAAEVINGKAAIYISLKDMDSGNYKLVVTAFVSEKKADQPLNLSGSWECPFAK